MEAHGITLILLVLASADLFGEASKRIGSIEQLVARFEQRDGRIDHTRLWGDLGVQSKLFDECPRGQISTVVIGRDAWKLVKLSNIWKSSWQFLVFRRETEQTWEFLGNIDFVDQHYEEPLCRSRTIGGRSWLVFQHIAGYGTGLLIRKEAWHPLSARVAKCELRYVSDAHFTELIDSVTYITTYKRTRLRTGSTNEKPTVAVSHTVVRKRLGADNKEEVLSRRNIITHFIWSEEENHFVATGVAQDPRIVDNQ